MQSSVGQQHTMGEGDIRSDRCSAIRKLVSVCAATSARKELQVSDSQDTIRPTNSILSTFHQFLRENLSCHDLVCITLSKRIEIFSDQMCEKSHIAGFIEAYGSSSKSLNLLAADISLNMSQPCCESPNYDFRTNKQLPKKNRFQTPTLKYISLKSQP